MTSRRGGRHPEADRVVVRFTDAAVDDLRSLDPQVVRWALKKCLLLQRDPEAGVPLRGGLVGYRKLSVSDRHWRIVWRVTHDEVGRVTIDVAEIWAVGARSDAAVYEEMTKRIEQIREDPRTLPFADALAALNAATHGLEVAAEPEILPTWLAEVLVTVLGMPRQQVHRLSPREAHALWDGYTTRPR